MGFKFFFGIFSDWLALLKTSTSPHFPSLCLSNLILTSHYSFPSSASLRGLQHPNKQAPSPSPSSRAHSLAGGRIWTRWAATGPRGRSRCHLGPRWRAAVAQEVAQQSPGTCGFQLDRSTAFLPLETPGAWRYARWWIPGLPVRRLQKGRKKKTKTVKSWTMAFSFTSRYSGCLHQKVFGKSFHLG